MQLRVLGCSGGIGEGLHTTSLLAGDQVLIDAGTGVSSLTVAQLQAIEFVFITHAHMDHIALLPMLIDTTFEQRVEKSLKVFALPEVLDKLKQHIFNWDIWPDFSQLPTPGQPAVIFEAIEVGQILAVDGVEVEVLPVKHSVPAVAYAIKGPDHTVVFSGDTGSNSEFWQALNALPQLHSLIIECAFSNLNTELAKLSSHYSPELLQRDMLSLKHRPEIYITHLKPGREALIMQQCQELMPERAPQRLHSGSRLSL